jgi:hypothetical protein
MGGAVFKVCRRDDKPPVVSARARGDLLIDTSSFVLDKRHEMIGLKAPVLHKAGAPTPLTPARGRVVLANRVRESFAVHLSGLLRPINL